MKLRYLVGLAHRICETIGTVDFPQVREALGSLAAKAGMIEAAVHAMEVKGSTYGPYFVPDRALLYAAGVLAQRTYPEIIETIRELAGGGMIMLPSSVRDFANPEIAALIGKTQLSANTDALGRVKLLKLAWDSVGSEFASRHAQYEMFYSGAKHFTIGNAYKTFDWKGAARLVDDLMAQYDLPGKAPQDTDRGTRCVTAPQAVLLPKLNAMSLSTVPRYPHEIIVSSSASAGLQAQTSMLRSPWPSMSATELGPV